MSVVRTASDAFLLDDSGSIFVQRSRTAPRPYVTLTERGRAIVWKPGPMSFALWRDHWLVVDGSFALRVFDLRGAHKETISLPIRATDITAGRRLYIYSAASDGRFWSSDDTRSFKPVNAPVVPKNLTGKRGTIAAMLMVTSSGEDVLFTRLIGSPTLHRLTQAGAITTMALAYRRTATRAAATEASSSIAEDAYSSVARDLFSPTAAEVLVLRNWEDENVEGKVVPFVGRRADIYDARTGRHLNTVTFPASMRWLLRREKDHVVGLSRAGSVIAVPLSAPVPAVIVR